MSAFLLGTGFRADMGTCIRKLVLLKLIDACEDDGSRIFPAIATVARAAQCSDRQVQREIRAFMDIGLLSLVRAGGQGRRSTNEYRLDLDVLAAISKAGWDAYALSRGMAAKGDTQSPLDGEAKGDADGTDRVTPETPKGDNGSPPTPPDSSNDPSTGARAARASAPREGEREGDFDDSKIQDASPSEGPAGGPASDSERSAREAKLTEKQFWRIVKTWPGFDGMPKTAALPHFAALDQDARDAAERRFPGWLALLKAQGKDHVPAPSTYFRERLFDVVTDPLAAPKPPVEAKPFGRLWGAVRQRRLLTEGPVALPPPPRAQADLLAEDSERGRQARLERQARLGWPTVNFMHEQAANRKGISVPAADEWLSALTEQVSAGSALRAAWKAEHLRRGWPWPSEFDRVEWIWFPAGGPAGLEEFERKVRASAIQADRPSAASGDAVTSEGQKDDHGDRPQAAE